MARFPSCESDRPRRTGRWVFSAAAVWLAQPAIPIILGIAAGAMLFIISHEIIPETHRDANNDLATFSLLTGVVLMLYMSVVLE